MPFFLHTNEGVGAPDATTESVTGWPCVAVVFTGCAVIAGAASAEASRSARICPLPLATNNTFQRFAGIVACPLLLEPQKTNVPFSFSATLWLLPPAIATTPLNPLGTVV